jgi:hypothetical protein
MIEMAACLTQCLLGHSLHLLKILLRKAVQSGLSTGIEAFQYKPKIPEKFLPTDRQA